jgi:PAS domain S-box-containing protein
MAEKETFLSKFLDLFGSAQIKLEKKRLEAFLDSVPQAYCGWDPDGSIAWNDAFVKQLGLDGVQNFADIQTCFEARESARLEAAFNTLRESGTPFSSKLTFKDGEKIFRIEGKRGENLDEDDYFDVLWLDEITEKEHERERRNAHITLLEKQNRFAYDASDTSPFPLWIRNRDLDIIWCNKAYAEIIGEPVSAIVATQLEFQVTLVDENNKNARREKITPRKLAEQAHEERKSIAAVGHVIVNGQRRLYLIREIPIGDRNSYLGTGQDITKEEELHDEMERYIQAKYDLLEQLRSAISIFNSKEQLIFYNSAFSQLWKLEDQYLNSKPKLGDIMEKLREQRMLPEQADFRSFKKSWLNMFTDLIDSHEDMLYLPDSKALRMLAVPHPLGGLMMMFEDVSSSLELESSYNTLIAVQRETLDNLAEGVSVFGGDGRLRLWNPSFAKIWGFHPEDLDGSPHITRLVEKMKPYFDAQFWPEYYDRLLSLGLERVERKGRMTRGDDLVIDYVTVPLPDGGMLVTYTDMTDTVQVEQALREKNTALETAERLKLDFLANVSYQLRTPLNNIMGFTDMLDGEYAGKLTKQQKDYTQSISESSELLLNLINDVLDLSTIEAGYLILDKGDFDVSEMLRGLYELMRDWARQKRIDIRLDCADNIGWVNADERRVKQAVLNLMRNAISFTPDDGSGLIDVTAKKDGPRVVISVKDNGVGIPIEEQDRIFEPFERSVTTAAENMSGTARGAGLGLSLVKNIVELHGGSVKLTSRVNEGTEVQIAFPLNRKDK